MDYNGFVPSENPFGGPPDVMQNQTSFMDQPTSPSMTMQNQTSFMDQPMDTMTMQNEFGPNSFMDKEFFDKAKEKFKLE